MEVLVSGHLSRELALGALRLSLGRWSTQEEIEAAAELIVERVKSNATPQGTNYLDYSI